MKKRFLCKKLKGSMSVEIVMVFPLVIMIILACVVLMTFSFFRAAKQEDTDHRPKDYYLYGLTGENLIDIPDNSRIMRFFDNDEVIGLGFRETMFGFRTMRMGFSDITFNPVASSLLHSDRNKFTYLYLLVYSVNETDYFTKQVQSIG